ncbi:hypothetical protein Fmac_013046 [Flemingia macrophylla]|uniref:Uncharacterized protein n=1 Tax=Flemingia macrophylla TaxID=520843 RepID=A0ABD1MUA0_9FABA
MVERRRKALILCSTKHIIKSTVPTPTFHRDDQSFPTFRLPVGILRFSGLPKPSLDQSALIALSTRLLKTLSIASVAVALDPPTTTSIHLHSPSSSLLMLLFPSCDFPLSDTLASYFKPQGKRGDGDATETNVDSLINVELEPLARPPWFAYLLRVSFVKIPKCGILKSIRATSSVESQERQDMIDLALQKYFEVDRHLSKGDVFGITISWNCNSPICVPYNQGSLNKNDNLICFKVVGMEPLDEPVFRVNNTLIALVLVGSSPSAIPPDLLIGGPQEPVPLQGDTVKNLASILTPTICPSVLSSKFRVSVLLYGLAGFVVRYVACRLGLHVVEYSCHDLMVSDRTSVALAQVFKMAQRYAPAILLLRHFDVFRDSQSPEGFVMGRFSGDWRTGKNHLIPSGLHEDAAMQDNGADEKNLVQKKLKRRMIVRMKVFVANIFAFVAPRAILSPNLDQGLIIYFTSLRIVVVQSMIQNKLLQVVVQDLQESLLKLTNNEINLLCPMFRGR